MGDELTEYERKVIERYENDDMRFFDPDEVRERLGLD